MKWFKHDSSAHRDVKLKKLKQKYGIVGYGLYWYCIELIAFSVERNNITFELEDDAETIAVEWGLDQLKVQEIMEYMVNLKLFESDNGQITCLKLAKRLDDTNSKNPEIRRILALIEGKKFDGDFPNHSEQIGVIPSKSELLGETPKDSEDVGDSPKDSAQIRLDKIRIEKDKTYCASVPEVAMDEKPVSPKSEKPDKPDNPDDPDLWKSEKGKVLTLSQQKIFGQLWEAFDYKKGRAPAIDAFLKHLLPWFGKDKEANLKNLQTLLDAIAKHVATRNQPGNTSTPLYFERWISKRRWEDDYPLESKIANSMSDQSPEGIAKTKRPIWETQGFDNAEHWQDYVNISNNLKTLTDLKKPTVAQQRLILERQEQLKKLAPKIKTQVAE